MKEINARKIGVNGACVYCCAAGTGFCEHKVIMKAAVTSDI